MLLMLLVLVVESDPSFNHRMASSARDLPYGAEYAKSGRAACKGCDGLISQVGSHFVLVLTLYAFLHACICADENALSL